MDNNGLRRYSIPSEKGEGWGVFLIDNTGILTAITDYGNYGHWFSISGDMRDFIIGCGDSESYLMGKFGRKSEYDNDRTCDGIKQYILDSRRSGGLTKDKARNEWLLLCENNELYDYDDLMAWYGETTLDVDMSETVYYDFPSDVKAFVKNLIPRFAVMLTQELEAERVIVV